MLPGSETFWYEFGSADLTNGSGSESCSLSQWRSRCNKKKCFVQCCGSGMFIPELNFFHPWSRIRIFPIPDPNFSHPGFATNSLRFHNQKMFSSSRNYDPGCSSRIRILIFYLSWIPDPGVEKAPDPGYGSSKLVFYYFCFMMGGSGRPKNLWIRNTAVNSS